MCLKRSVHRLGVAFSPQCVIPRQSLERSSVRCKTAGVAFSCLSGGYPYFRKIRFTVTLWLARMLFLTANQSSYSCGPCPVIRTRSSSLSARESTDSILSARTIASVVVIALYLETPIWHFNLKSQVVISSSFSNLRYVVTDCDLISRAFEIAKCGLKPRDPKHSNSPELRFPAWPLLETALAE